MPTAHGQRAWRPGFHYTPARNWMNDPNGLFFLNGVYHLYYQYNPSGSQWGNMSWGHAVSRDLRNWTEQDVALPFTPERMVFSGTVVVDCSNVAGFAEAGFSVPPVLAFYTAFDPVSSIQSQHLAYSLDGGYCFTDYSGNPVLDIGSSEFRDPKVFWHAPSGRWVMLVVAALQQQVWFYTSRDLKQWNKVSSFGPAGSAKGNIWEVPELFELPVDGDPSRTRWVLIVSVNRGSLWGGSGVQYFTGQFDGERFVADASGLPADASGPDAAVWADHGRDFYAPITFANLPDGRCVWMGWINNWEYAGEVPTDPWRGQMSVPRELDLVSTRHGLRLRQRPARELREWAEQAALVFDGQGTSQELAARLTDARLGGQALHISLRVPLKELRGEFGLRVFETSTSCVTLGFDAGAQIFFTDRRSAESRLQAGQERHTAARVFDDPMLTLEVWTDGCVLEVYCDGGSVVFTDMVFMPAACNGVSLVCSACKPQSLALQIRNLTPTMPSR